MSGNRNADNIDDEPRPKIADEYNNELSHHDIDLIYDKLYKKDLYDNKKSIFDLTLNQIIQKTISFLDHFQSDYSEKLYEVDLIEKDESRKKNSAMKYLTAFGLYIRENDNVIYLGIVLVILSFIIYFFNITTQA